MTELMELGITAIEKLELKRKPFPNMNAIYFISPTMDSAKKLKDDFQYKKRPLYDKIHVILSNQIPKDVMEAIAKDPEIMSHLKTFKELSLDFPCPDENLMNLEMPEALSVLFSQRESPEAGNLTDLIASKFATIIPSIDKYNKIEVLYNSASKCISRNVGLKLFDKLTDYNNSMSKLLPEYLDPEAGRIVILVVDRQSDPVAPLLYDFYYQPMIYELLNVENDIVDYEDEKNEKKKAVLGESDDLFRKYKFQHIVNVLEGAPEKSLKGIPTEFKEFIQSNSTAKFQMGQTGHLDLSKMSEIVKTMPQYNEILKKYSVHMNLISRSMKVLEDKGLNEISELEQSLVTGIDKEGKTVSDIKMLSQVGSRLNSGKLNDQDKLKLGLVTIIALEISEKDKKGIIDLLPPDSSKVFSNLIWLGIGKAESKKKAKVKKQEEKGKSGNASFSRVTPFIELVAEGILQKMKKGEELKGTYGNVKFDILKLNESAQSQSTKPTSLRVHKAKGALNLEDDVEIMRTCPKLIILSIGGMSYGEIRALRNLREGPEDVAIILGATSLLKSKDYIDAISKMKSGELGV